MMHRFYQTPVRDFAVLVTDREVNEPFFPEILR
jgi:hypothetical protein